MERVQYMQYREERFLQKSTVTPPKAPISAVDLQHYIMFCRLHVCQKCHFKSPNLNKAEDLILTSNPLAAEGEFYGYGELHYICAVVSLCWMYYTLNSLNCFLAT